MWACKDCCTTVGTRFHLLKHYRLVHTKFGRRHPYPCTYSDWPCAFKTLNALHSHLSRSHANQSVPKCVTTTILDCQLCTVIDELLAELHYLLGSASVPISNEVIIEFLKNHNVCVDQIVVKELTTALSSCNPLLKAIAKEGPLATAHKRQKYYKENFEVVEPVEYILKNKSNFPVCSCSENLTAITQTKRYTE